MRLFPESVQAVEQLRMQPQPHGGVGLGDARRAKQLAVAQSQAQVVKLARLVLRGFRRARSRASKQEGAKMRYKPRGVAALQIILGGFPDTMQVEIDKNIGGVSAKTVGELRKVTTWPGNLAVITPDARYPESIIKVGKAGGPKRVSPKP